MPPIDLPVFDPNLPQPTRGGSYVRELDGSLSPDPTAAPPAPPAPPPPAPAPAPV